MVKSDWSPEDRLWKRVDVRSVLGVAGSVDSVPRISAGSGSGPLRPVAMARMAAATPPIESLGLSPTGRFPTDYSSATAATTRRASIRITSFSARRR
jgi:hypothetical protein